MIERQVFKGVTKVLERVMTLFSVQGIVSIFSPRDAYTLQVEATSSFKLLVIVDSTTSYNFLEEDRCLLGCDTVSLGKLFMMVQRIILLSFSGSSSSNRILLGLLVLWNV
jgi:hypothetical protein